MITLQFRNELADPAPDRYHCLSRLEHACRRFYLYTLSFGFNVRDGDADPDLILWDETALDLYTIEDEIATFAGSFPTLGGEARVPAGDIDGR